MKVTASLNLDPAFVEKATLTVLRLRSGLDNADRGADGKRELGGVVLTMNDAADLINALLTQLAEVSHMLALHPSWVNDHVMPKETTK